MVVTGPSADAFTWRCACQREGKKPLRTQYVEASWRAHARHNDSGCGSDSFETIPYAPQAWPAPLVEGALPAHRAGARCAYCGSDEYERTGLHHCYPSEATVRAVHSLHPATRTLASFAEAP